MKIALCSSEIFPFAKTGGLGDVCGSLPLALEREGMEVVLFMPGYRCIGQSGVTIEQLNGQVSRARIGSNIRVYFVDHDVYYDRAGLYGDQSGDYPDNLQRFSYFCRNALTIMQDIDFQPDIIHCHDWQTALIPVYLNQNFGAQSFFEKAKTILTIHNLAFQGLFPKGQFADLGLTESLWSEDGFEYYNQINLLKAGILFSDQVMTVSARYAKEIQTAEFGCGLENVLARHEKPLIGILNGLDTEIWNPMTDPNIAQTFDKKNIKQAKSSNKRQLQNELSLKVSDEKPLFGYVGRLSHQKGVEMLTSTLESMVKQECQCVILGVGDQHYEESFHRLADQYAESVAVCTQFNEPLGHRIYAGSDFFLMPSLFEPCGLSQMISLRYAALPIVFKTGGLVDTVKPCTVFHRNGNGFMFTHYTQEHFLKQIKLALHVFSQKNRLNQMRTAAYESDFSWEQSSKAYVDVYQRMFEEAEV